LPRAPRGGRVRDAASGGGGWGGGATLHTTFPRGGDAVLASPVLGRPPCDAGPTWPPRTRRATANQRTRHATKQRGGRRLQRKGRLPLRRPRLARIPLWPEAPRGRKGSRRAVGA